MKKDREGHLTKLWSWAILGPHPPSTGGSQQMGEAGGRPQEGEGLAPLWSQETLVAWMGSVSVADHSGFIQEQLKAKVKMPTGLLLCTPCPSHGIPRTTTPLCIV